MSAAFLQAIAVPPTVTAASFTLEAIGARIAVLMAEERGPAPRPNHGEEKVDLAEHGLALPVHTLADAAVACDLAFGHADGVLASEVDLAAALRAMATLRRVVVRVGRVICTTAGLDPHTVAWNDLGSELADRVVAGVEE